MVSTSSFTYVGIAAGCLRLRTSRTLPLIQRRSAACGSQGSLPQTREIVAASGDIVSYCRSQTAHRSFHLPRATLHSMTLRARPVIAV